MNQSPVTRTLLLIGTLLWLFSSCAPTQPIQDKQIEEIEIIDSPAGPESSLPYLIKGDNDHLYLSWVERLNDTTILKYAWRENDQWSAPQTIAQGIDWFVNWADYPMISADQQGQMMAHFPGQKQ